MILKRRREGRPRESKCQKTVSFSVFPAHPNRVSATAKEGEEAKEKARLKENEKERCGHGLDDALGCHSCKLGI